MNAKDTPIERVMALVERAISDEVGRHANEKFWVTHYGANHIHPKHLVYWIVVGSDHEKRRLEAHSALMAALRSLLAKGEQGQILRQLRTANEVRKSG